MLALKRRKRIAIVDDDPSMLRAVGDLLRAHGFETDLFSSAEEWLDRSASAQVDCVVVDIHLGGMSGLQLQHQLKTAGSTLPVIFMTALEDETVRGQALEVGAAACLLKPFSSQQLIEVIERTSSAKAKR